MNKSFTMDLYIIAVSYTHLDVYKRQLYSILPQNTRTKNTCKGQVGDTTIVLNEKDINNYSVRPDSCLLYTSNRS